MGNKIIKGFTLIELLAVIVILAIISLIATPIIINVVENSRMKAFENSVYGVIETYKLKTIDDEDSIGVVYSFPEGNNELKYSGTKMIDGDVFLTPSKDIEVRKITDGKYCANGNKGNLLIKKGDCTIDLANDPILKTANNTGMTDPFLNAGIARNDIESVEFVMVSSFPAGSIDVSESGNGKVMLWTKDENNDTRPEVYIGAINDLIYANKNSTNLFYNMRTISKIDLKNLDTSAVTNMSNMFAVAGNSSTNFILNLGNNFDTSNVVAMEGMFVSVGVFDPNFTLNLGDKFDTSAVTNMNSMFANTGNGNPNFVLNLGNKFDTSNVVDMRSMFQGLAKNNLNFTLNLGDKFNTSKVRQMRLMFDGLGKDASNLIINLGDKFDTSKVYEMSSMFSQTGQNSVNFTLSLGDKFDTSNVESMYRMFYNAGSSTSNFVLNLGDKFNLDKVSDTTDTFQNTGKLTSLFKPNATVKTQGEKNAILAKFPNINVTVIP